MARVSHDKLRASEASGRVYMRPRSLDEEQEKQRAFASVLHTASYFTARHFFFFFVRAQRYRTRSGIILQRSAAACSASSGAVISGVAKQQAAK